MSVVFYLAASITLATSSGAEQSVPSSLNLDTIRAITMQHDGRWPPLDTVARDMVEEITGDPQFGEKDPVATLLAWTFDPAGWKQQPLLPIPNAELRSHLQLPESQTVFSYADMMNHRHLHKLIDDLARIEEGRKPDPLESAVSKINGKLITMQRMFRGEVLRPIPNAEEGNGAWYAIPDPKRGDVAGLESVLGAWSAVRTTFLAEDSEGFAKASQDLAGALDALPAAYRPAPKLIDRELRYNRLAPFRMAWIVMVIGAIFAALAMVVRSKWFDAVSFMVLIAGFGTLTFGLWLRWGVAGRIPASNMFESLLFLSWGMGAFAIVANLALPHRIVPLTASFMGALSLLLADCLPLDSYIRPIAPVLSDTIWMGIHVPIIMVSYSVLALGVLFAHVQVVGMALAPRSERFSQTIDTLHYWYIHVGSILLLAGIVTGSMWASSSWGRYWGWDPKEVWSLVALLGYLTILHVRIDFDRVPGWALLVALCLVAVLFVVVVPKLGPTSGVETLALGGTAGAMLFLLLGRGPFATAVKSIMCFWLIIMTYVGVNYVLGIGLHSYGFGTGAMAKWMLLFGSADLAVIAVFSAFYIVRIKFFAGSPGVAAAPVAS